MSRTNLQRLALVCCTLVLLAAGVSEAMVGGIDAPARVSARPVRVIRERPALLVEQFDRADGLITNAFAFWNPNSESRRSDLTWQLTSGSLFAASGAGWTGRPDSVSPDATSTAATGSAVFRMTTRRSDFRDVRVSLRLSADEFVSTERTPAVAWDGLHIWLRHVDQYNLYAASVLRRDGTVVLKKKCRGGPENGGTYYEIGEKSTGHHLPLGVWHDVAVSAENVDGGVRLTVEIAGDVVLSVVDRGVGCAPIMQTGAVGIRGDNTTARFDDITIEQL